MKIGIDLGGSHIGIGIVNARGRIIEKRETDLNFITNVKIEDFISQYILNTIEEFTKKYKIQSIGIAAPGTPKDGKITTMVNLGIKEFDITNIINKKYSIPVNVRNDAKCAAMAENKYGNLKEYKDSIFICLGTGIGGSVFINKKELKFNRNPGIEIGHMIIQKDGIACKCGKNGCFETYCSIKRLKQKLIETMQLPKNTESKELLEILRERKDETKVKDILNEYIENLIVGLSNIIDIFEPQAICFGGGFVYFEEILYKILVEKYYSKKYMFNKENIPELKLSLLGNDAGIIGATQI